MKEIELAYVHVPTFYNAKIETENKTNTVQETMLEELLGNR